ncbi:MAG: SAM-dependent methyltransferase, partial [Alphaproteobacteria bacterium]|nr:SAM-dependent methyltransferase [Alphaproteobacteria bacterium]
MIANLALALVSAGVLAYEVLLVRLFAIVQWHHFAFMAISIALLGFGAAGSMLALAQDRLRRHAAASFAGAAVLFALSAPLAFLAAQAIPFNAKAVVWDPWQLAALPAMYLVLVVPFFFGAGYIALAFLQPGARPGRVYAVNLLGSGAGALGIVGALFLLSPADGLRLVAGLGLAAALLVLLDERRMLATGLAALGLLACAAMPESWLALRISPYKSLSTALAVSDARLLEERSSPLGLLSVVESPAVPFRYVPGLSLTAPAMPPEQLGVFIDGDGMTAIDRGAERDYLGYTTDAAAYGLLDRPTVLVLGAGGGRSVAQALLHDATHIDAVELDANMAELVRSYASDLHDRSEVAWHIGEARGFVTASDMAWDLIQIPLLDAMAGSGMHGLNESYLYTVEAFETYLAHLAPGGWLSITRWLR